MTSTSTTCFLYHGPTAKSSALSKVLELGKLEARYGESPSPVWLAEDSSRTEANYHGLYVVEAREIVQRVMLVPASYTAVFLLGPMCNTGSEDAADVLLKTLEDPPPHVRIVLWAWDIGSVRPPILSRTRPVWCCGTQALHPDVVGLIPHAKVAVSSWLSGDYTAACLLTKEHAKKDPIAWIHAVSSCLPRSGKAVLPLWADLRELLSRGNPQMAEVLGVWLHGAK